MIDNLHRNPYTRIVTKQKPTLEELAADAVREEAALMLEAEKIKSDAFLGLLEERKVKVMLIAVQTYRHLREVAARN